ncbi:MAG: DUF4097 family beta strand repeat-containing protein [Bacteroidetes bacterium]|nr:DUF4097 family beta strand repeat-containing protein [Bacteroidota bacterium]
MMKNSFFRIPVAFGGIVICAFVLVAFQPFPVEKDVIKKEFKVNPGGMLSLDFDRGNIEIEGTDDNSVKIELERRARAESSDEAERLLESAHRYEFEQDGDDVEISSRVEDERGRMRWRKGPAVKIRLTVRVPSEYDIDFKTGAGNVTIMEVHGEITGRTGAGNLLIEDVKGELDIKSGAGNIEVSGTLQEAEIITGAGNLSIYGQVEELNAMAGTGNVTAEIDGQPEGESKLRTGAGNVSLSLSKDVQLEVKGTASLGTVSCEFPIEISKKLLSHSFSGEINGGGDALIVMTAGVGNVSLLRH